MTNPTVTQVVQQSSLSDESKLNAMLMFALLRSNLTCSFASFLRYMDGPARSDVAAFTQAMQAGKLPPAVQVHLMAAYLDAQEAGGSFTLQQYADQLMNAMRHVEEEQFVNRVVTSQPNTVPPATSGYIAPAAPPQPMQQQQPGGPQTTYNGYNMPPQQPVQAPPQANAGWGAFAGGPTPGPQAALPTTVPPATLPVSAAISPGLQIPFDVGDTAGPPPQTAPQPGGWGAIDPNTPSTPQEADIPDADPLPDWFRVGARASYELGDQKILVTIQKIVGRHATIVSDTGQTFHSVAPAHLVESQEPYEFEYLLTENSLQEIEAKKAYAAGQSLTPFSTIRPIADFTRVSPIDGTKLYVELKLVSGEQPGSYVFAMLISSATLEPLARVIGPELVPDWTVTLGETVYHLRLNFPVQAPPEAATEPAQSAESEPQAAEKPAKAKAPRKRPAAKATKK